MGRLNAALALGLGGGPVIGGILKDAFSLNLVFGGMITSGMMVMTVITPFAGLWADRISKRTLIVAGGATASAGILVLAVLTRPWEFYLSSILLGLAGGLSAPAVTALAVMIGNRGLNQGRTMAVLGTAESSGLVCGPVSAGLVADVWGLPVALGGAALLALVSTIPALFLVSEPGSKVP